MFAQQYYTDRRRMAQIQDAGKSSGGSGLTTYTYHSFTFPERCYYVGHNPTFTRDRSFTKVQNLNATSASPAKLPQTISNHHHESQQRVVYHWSVV